MTDATNGMTRGLAALGSGLALAVTATWVLTGAQAPTPDSAHGAASPLALVLNVFTARGFGVVSSAVTWSIAIDVALAAGLGIVLAARLRKNPHAQRLGLALGCLSAGLSLLFIAGSFPPLHSWIAGPSSGRLSFDSGTIFALACSVIAFSLLGAGIWILARFWMAYPAAVDPYVLREFVRQRYDPAQWEGKRWFMSYPIDERSTARAVARIELLGDMDKVHKGALAYSLIRRCALAAGFWWLGSAVAGAVPLKAPGMGALLVGGLTLITVTVVFHAPLMSIADVIALHIRSESGGHRRKIEWLQVVDTWGRVVTNAFFPVACLVGLPIALLSPAPQNDLFETLFLISVVLPFALQPGLLVLALGAAIFARGLVDPRLALKKASLWTLLGLAIAIVFVLVERFVALQLVRWLALPAESGAIIAGVAVAITFVPIRRAVETWVNRFVEKRMPARLLASGDAHIGAVAVVDISGFTALSAHDEPAALLATTFLQREARRLCDTNDGRVVKCTGDGAILVFDDANDAAKTLRQLHAAFERGLEPLSLPPLTLHSGAHWGDYVDVRGTDIYGQTVNVASRLADAATSGEILISDAFAKALGPHEPAPAPVGARRFKNVPEPVECLRLAI